MSLWDRLVYLIVLSFLLPYLAEIRPTDFVQFNAKTQGIFAQPIAALSLVVELPTHSSLSLLRHTSTCGTAATLKCLRRLPALRHPVPSACMISALTFVHVLAAFLPQQQVTGLFQTYGC